MAGAGSRKPGAGERGARETWGARSGELGPGGSRPRREGSAVGRVPRPDPRSRSHTGLWLRPLQAPACRASSESRQQNPGKSSVSENHSFLNRFFFL